MIGKEDVYENFLKKLINSYNRYFFSEKLYYIYMYIN